MQVTNAIPQESTKFGQDLRQCVASTICLKQTYPKRWKEVCQQALDEGEITLADALSGLITAQMLLEES